MAQICAACGNTLEGNEKFCRVCGRQFDAPITQGMASAQTPIPAGQAETSPKAVISLVCGLLFFIPLAFLAAIIFGHLGLSEIRKSAGRLKGEGLAIAGLILGYLWIAGIPMLLIVAAIAIPNLLRARIAANEASAVAMVRTVAAAETTYAVEHPQEGFTCSLSSLTDSNPRVRGIVNGQRLGYVFELSGCTSDADGGAKTKYQIFAYPLRIHQTGVKAFCTDETGVVKADADGSPQQCQVSGSELR